MLEKSCWLKKKMRAGNFGNIVNKKIYYFGRDKMKDFKIKGIENKIHFGNQSISNTKNHLVALVLCRT